MPLIYKHVPIYLQNEVITCVRQCLAQVNHHLNRHYLEPKIVYRPKGSIAGSAYLTRWEIQLNSQLLCENKLDFIKEVVPHELAHLIVFKEFGKVRPHGKEWKYMMSSILGKDPKVRHHFFVSRPNYVYRCQCQEHHLTQIRHNKMQNQHIQYSCKKCGTLLELKN